MAKSAGESRQENANLFLGERRDSGSFTWSNEFSVAIAPIIFKNVSEAKTGKKSTIEHDEEKQGKTGGNSAELRRADRDGVRRSLTLPFIHATVPVEWSFVRRVSEERVFNA